MDDKSNPVPGRIFNPDAVIATGRDLKPGSGVAEIVLGHGATPQSSLATENTRLREALEVVRAELKITVDIHKATERRHRSLGPGYPQGPCSCDDCRLYDVVVKALQPA